MARSKKTPKTEETPAVDPERPKPRDRTRAAPPKRRFSRVTPRRWLPFLALIAVVGGGIVVSQQDDVVPATRPVASPGVMIPVAAPSDALSTAFFCPGGTAQGADGGIELSVVVTNSKAQGTTADVTVIGNNDKTAEFTVDVPASGQTEIVASEHLSSDWAAVTVEALGGDIAVEQRVTGPLGFDAAPCPTRTSETWYIPNGSAAIGAIDQLLVYNPFPAPASFSIEFTTEAGTSRPGAVQNETVPARSLRVYDTADLVPRRNQIAARLTTRSGQLVLGRAQRFTGTGSAIPAVREAPEIAAPKGLAVTPALPVTSTRWVFPSTQNDPAVQNSVAIYNPGEGIAEIDLWLFYENRDLSAEIEPIAVTVRGGDLELVDLRDRPGLNDGIPYSIFLESRSTSENSAAPVVAELQSINAVVPSDLPPTTEEQPAGEGGDNEGVGGEDDHVHTGEEGDEHEEPPADETATPVTLGLSIAPGSPVAASSWLVPRVDVSKTHRAEVVVVNPGTAEVQVSTTAVVGGDRRDLAKPVKIGPRDRITLDLTSLDAPTALEITSTGGPVVVGTAAVGLDKTVGIARSLGSPVPGTVRTLPSLLLE